MTKTMTDRRHTRAPLRRSSTPERILSAGLATATCVGVVGLLGARTIEANASSAGELASEQVETAQVADPSTADAPVEPTTAGGLTQADLDAYAADLAKEKERLDAYRAKLVKTAKKLKRQIAAENAAAAAAVPARPASSGSSGSAGSSGSSGSAGARLLRCSAPVREPSRGLARRARSQAGAAARGGTRTPARSQAAVHHQEQLTLAGRSHQRASMTP